MKKDFFDAMDAIMKKNPNVYLIMAGLGWPRTPEFLEKYPNRAMNTEASEQTALDIAVGLAYSGKIPVVYTITPFYFRAFETIRTYIDHENLGVILIGAGRDDDYSKHDGFSHYAGDDKKFFTLFEKLKCYWPKDVSEMKNILKLAIDGNEYNAPTYINIKK